MRLVNKGSFCRPLKEISGNNYGSTSKLVSTVILGHTPNKQRTDVLQFLTGLELLSGDDEEGGEVDTGVLVRLNLEPFSVPAAQDT